MNEHHAKLCPSPEWAAFLQSEVLPVVAGWADLGSSMLEVGPGPGASTDWLRGRVDHLTAVEVEAEAAAKLTSRFEGTNVEVVEGDATALTFADGTFDSAGSFTMLHHVPTVALQNRLFAEVLRVLKPGGVFIGSDSLPSDGLHRFHDDDTYNPIDPAGLIPRLQTIGFDNLTIRVGYGLMWAAHKPGPEDPGQDR